MVKESLPIERKRKHSLRVIVNVIFLHALGGRAVAEPARGGLRQVADALLLLSQIAGGRQAGAAQHGGAGKAGQKRLNQSIKH